MLEQPVIVAEPEYDAFLCPIASAIDENECRIKAEEARYTQLIANRQMYEYYMNPYDYKLLMREAATRLVNFDPVWDLSAEECPLPTPWETCSPSSRV